MPCSLLIIISMKLILVIIVIASFAFSSCFKNCSDTSYAFDTEAKVYPDKDSIRVGDTLWIEVTTPTTLIDNLSGKKVDYSGAENMGAAIQISSFHSGSIEQTGASYALDSFHYYLFRGSIYTTDMQASNYLYIETSGNYIFKLAIICERVGTYGVSISDAVNVFRKKDKCSKATYAMQITNTDQHMYLYQNSRPGYEASDYEKKHVYFFKVY